MQSIKRACHNIFTKEHCNMLMKKGSLHTKDYALIRDKIQNIGREREISLKKRKTQRKMVLQIWRNLNLHHNLKPLFVTNLYIYDDKEFIYQIHEAITAGVRVEDISTYIKANYRIPEAIYHLKIAEFRYYQSYFETINMKEMVLDILKKIDPIRVSKEDMINEKVKLQQYKNETAKSAGLEYVLEKAS